MLQKNILFYDGDCALCNKSVQFVIDHEKENVNPILFCSLQSAYAKQALQQHNYDFNQLSTLVLLIDNKVLYKSTAALELTNFLKTPYNWLIILKIFPRFIRDGVYDYIARNRKIIIKEKFCYVPSPKLKHRFID
jgi:predicted DCC family thiol-disulfide oxidoreductase YuxK